jgi:hypothetical protein
MGYVSIRVCAPRVEPVEISPPQQGSRNSKPKYLIRNKLCVEYHTYFQDGIMSGFVDPMAPCVPITCSIISPSGWSPWLSLDAYYGWSVSWLAVDQLKPAKTLHGMRVVALNRVNLKLLCTYGVFLLLSDLYLPALGQHLWTGASSLRVSIDCHTP